MLTVARDLELWLSQKLAEPWSSAHLSTAITEELAAEIASRFDEFETVVKLRVLFSMLSLSRGLLTKMRPSVERILSIARVREKSVLGGVSVRLSARPSVRVSRPVLSAVV
jgi:hypothetical protein